MFHTAAIMLFGQQLVLLGPTAFVILGNSGGNGYLSFARLYPAFISSTAAATGYWLFKRSNLP